MRLTLELIPHNTMISTIRLIVMVIHDPELRMVQRTGPDSWCRISGQQLPVMNHADVVDICPRQTSMADSERDSVDEFAQVCNIPVSTS